MRPPCSSTMPRAMLSPSPVPPLFRDAAPPACWKRPKILSVNSGGMPGPRSRTSTVIASSPLCAERSTVAPAGENLIALDTRFVNTWISRSASPITSAALSSLETRSVTFASRARASSPATVMSSSGVIRSRSCRTVDWPASILSMSRMSLMRRINRSVLLIAICSSSRPRPGRSPVLPPRMRPSAPRIEVSGVRSSWLTVETKSVFSRSSSLSFTMSSCNWRSRACMLTDTWSNVAARRANSRFGARSASGSCACA